MISLGNLYSFLHRAYYFITKRESPPHPLYPWGTSSIRPEKGADESPSEDILRARLCTRVYTKVYPRVYHGIHVGILFPPR